MGRFLFQVFSNCPGNLRKDPAYWWCRRACHFLLKAPEMNSSFRGMKTALEILDCMRDTTAKYLFWVRSNFWILIALSETVLLNISILYSERWNVAPDRNYWPDIPWTVKQYGWLHFIVRKTVQDLKCILLKFTASLSSRPLLLGLKGV